MTKKYFFSKLFFWHFLPSERIKAWEGMVSESQKQFYMVNSELLSKMYCVLPNFAHKLRNEIGLFRSDIPTKSLQLFILSSLHKIDLKCFPKRKMQLISFLDASQHLYKRVCPSVGRSVGRMVTQTFEMCKTADSDKFLHSYHLSCLTTFIFIHSFVCSLIH